VWGGVPGGYRNTINDNLVLVLMIETLEGLKNADEIAKFFSGANPNLPESAVKGLFVAHAGHHQQLTGEIMKGDTAAADKTWSAMQAHMNTIADALSDGIAKQFPAKAT